MASNEECTIGKEPVSELMLEKALEKLKIEVTDRIEKDNKQNLDEITDRLSLIESSISKLLKLNETAQKSNDDSMKEPVDEPTVQSENATKVASKISKRFKLKHVFKNVSKFKENVEQYSEKEDHYNTNWSMGVVRLNKHLGFYVHCEPITPADNWSIRTKLYFKVIGPNQNDVIKTWEFCYETSQGFGFLKFLDWKGMEKCYLVDGNLTVEVNGEIIETAGLGKEKIRKFDESQKDVSDVILVVKDTKFYVSKMFLASQSLVFKALLLGNFSESQQSEVTLNGIDPDDFHSFLEVLYGESAINDSNVEGVSLLADMYDAPTAIRRCEEFLLEKSKKKLEKKLEIAARFNLDKLKEKCL
ncbi:hypothetical protein B9Z55_007710 [Caenorhabditis nigoni]|uniref:BTB domain-containing protein n=1 Tax=Caenorhabditis nigoni TaxID=1611254 RepID=A0A2G5VB06_9PELO|nr:hypothetical protein B9Z55_007710 [Caenorhabditis nigoni]